VKTVTRYESKDSTTDDAPDATAARDAMVARKRDAWKNPRRGDGRHDPLPGMGTGPFPRIRDPKVAEAYGATSTNYKASNARARAGGHNPDIDATREAMNHPGPENFNYAPSNERARANNAKHNPDIDIARAANEPDPTRMAARRAREQARKKCPGDPAPLDVDQARMAMDERKRNASKGPSRKDRALAARRR
jgi:hypothetical protein